jgi:hypothetical protein
MHCIDADQHQNRNGHYATSWKVAGFIPDEVIIFFDWPNPWSPEKESVSKRNEYQESSWGVKSGRCESLTTTPPWAECLENARALMSHNHMGLYGLLQG